jgi:hypothetical protein
MSTSGISHSTEMKVLEFFVGIIWLELKKTKGNQNIRGTVGAISSWVFNGYMNKREY